MSKRRPVGGGAQTRTNTHPHQFPPSESREGKGRNLYAPVAAAAVMDEEHYRYEEFEQLHSVWAQPVRNGVMKLPISIEMLA